MQPIEFTNHSNVEKKIGLFLHSVFLIAGWCLSCKKTKLEAEFLIEASRAKKNLRGKLASQCKECHVAISTKKQQGLKECKKVTLEALFEEFHKDRVSEERYKYLFMFLTSSREGIVRHNKVYYHVTNASGHVQLDPSTPDLN